MSNQQLSEVMVEEEDDDFCLDEEEDNFLDIEDAQIKKEEETDTPYNYTTTKKSNLDVSDTNEFFNKAEQDANCINYPKGFPEGFYVVHHYTAPSDGFDMTAIHPDSTGDGTNATTRIIHEKEIIRSSISSTNMTLPHALMLLDPIEYPSLSRARKACRYV